MMSQPSPNPYASPQQASAPAPPPYPYATQRTSATAVLSLVFSCASFVIGPIGMIVGIILGHVALGEMRQDPMVTGRGLAVAGLVIGYILLVIMLLIILAVVGWVFYASAPVNQPMQQLPQPQKLPLEVPE